MFVIRYQSLIIMILLRIIIVYRCMSSLHVSVSCFVVIVYLSFWKVNHCSKKKVAVKKVEEIAKVIDIQADASWSP